MRNRLLISTALLAMIIGGSAITDTAQAGVIYSGASTQRAAQSLDLTDRIRRICRTRFTCERFPCRFVQQCYVTRDYPPEHGRR